MVEGEPLGEPLVGDADIQVYVARRAWDRRLAARLHQGCSPRHNKSTTAVKAERF
jgi:hypothetical protein